MLLQILKIIPVYLHHTLPNAVAIHYPIQSINQLSIKTASEDDDGPNNDDDDSPIATHRFDAGEIPSQPRSIPSRPRSTAQRPSQSGCALRPRVSLLLAHFLVPLTPVHSFRILRCTVNAVPTSAELLSKCGVPLGLSLQPLRALSSSSVPLPQIRHENLVRCVRCQAYLNPYVILSPDLMRWKCNVCAMPNEMPNEAICGEERRLCHPTERVQLHCPSFEIVAPGKRVGGSWLL